MLENWAEVGSCLKLTACSNFDAEFISVFVNCSFEHSINLRDNIIIVEFNGSFLSLKTNYCFGHGETGIETTLLLS